MRKNGVVSGVFGPFSKAALGVLALGGATLGILAVGGSAARAQESAPLAVVTGNDYRPFSDQGLPRGGMVTALVEEAFARQDVELAIDWLPWARGLDAAGAGDYRATFPYAINAKRHDLFFYSEPIYTVVNRLYHKTGAAPGPQALDELEGVVCLPAGYNLPPRLVSALDSGRITIDAPLDMTRCFELLALDRVDFVSATELQGWDLVRETAGLEPDDVTVTPFTVASQDLHVIAPRALGDESEQLIATFNAGLAALEADGAYDDLLVEFLGPDVTGRGAPAEVSSTLIGRAVELDMRDGSKLLGEVESLVGGAYSLRTTYGVVTAPTGEVLSLRFTEESEPRPDVLAALQETEDAAPRVLTLSGSYSVGERLAPALIDGFAASRDAGEPEWSVAGDRRVALFEAQPNFVDEAAVSIAGSATGFAALEAGEADIAMASRPISAAEVAALAKVGDFTDERAEHVLAVDGVAMLVHPDNPIEALDRATLAAIYRGEITDWGAIGGTPGPIQPLGRDEGSGARTVVEDLLGATAGGRESFARGSELSDRVAAQPGAIGYAGFGQIRNAKPIAIDECGVAHRPDAFAAKSEEYPFGRRLYLYNAPEIDNLFAASFVAFTESEEGQAIVREEGFVDLAIEAMDDQEHARFMAALAAEPAVVAGVRDQYRALADQARRLTATFRFRSASARLDARSERDVRRVAAWAQAADVDSSRLVLAGFADSRGDYGANRALSARRAEAVAAALALEGVEVGEVVAFGEERLVACDDDLRGQAVNRRVELWLR